MQITLPENTTHIVICTSGRGNNNEQNKDNNSNTSLTLDIKPNSSGTSLFDNDTIISIFNAFNFLHSGRLLSKT